MYTDDLTCPISQILRTFAAEINQLITENDKRTFNHNEHAAHGGRFLAVALPGHSHLPLALLAEHPAQPPRQTEI